MLLKDYTKFVRKDDIYNCYLRVVDNPKDYEKITAKKMVETIIETYNEEKYLYELCTCKELLLLDKILNNEITEGEINSKYHLEQLSLIKKFIISYDMEIFEEFISSIKKAISYYKKNKKIKTNNEKAFKIIIGFVRIFASINEQVLSNFIKDMFNLKEEQLSLIYLNPLFKFYCFYTKENKTNLLDTGEFYYADYWNYLEDIENQRVLYGNAGKILLNDKYFIEIFDYGYPISKNKSIKKMHDMIEDSDDIRILLLEDKIMYAMLTYDYKYIMEYLNKYLDKETNKLIMDALWKMPSPALNGLSPKELEELKEESELLDKQIKIEKQENAHLSNEDSNLFYKIYFALLEYTNNKYNINPSIRKIYKQSYLNPQSLLEIDKYIWENKSILNEFIKDNTYNFNKEELNIIKGFSSAKHFDYITIYGFEKDYTKMYDIDGKTYMVKGIRANIDEIVSSKNIPIVISTSLLMFKNNIIFNSFLINCTANIDLGNNFKELLINETKDSMIYYHL